MEVVQDIFVLAISAVTSLKEVYVLLAFLYDICYHVDVFDAISAFHG